MRTFGTQWRGTGLYWQPKHTWRLFFGYLGGLIVLTVLFVPELIYRSYYGFMQIGAAAVLTWITRSRLSGWVQRGSRRMPVFRDAEDPYRSKKRPTLH